MNLYKIEYNFNEKLWKEHKEAGTLPIDWIEIQPKLNSLNTHVEAETFLLAVDKVIKWFGADPYLSIAKLDIAASNLKTLR